MKALLWSLLHRTALVTLAFTSAAAAGPLPKDPCALLTTAEVQALAPDAKIGNGKADASAAPLGTSCTYAWGPRSPQWGETSVTVTVMDTAKGYPGMSVDTLKQGLLAMVHVKRENASQVAGVGDVAVFSFETRSHNAKLDTILGAKGYHLQVRYHHGDAAATKDKLAALAKAAAGRL